jgi:hypothetical protein
MPGKKAQPATEERLPHPARCGKCSRAINFLRPGGQTSEFTRALCSEVHPKVGTVKSSDSSHCLCLVIKVCGSCEPLHRTLCSMHGEYLEYEEDGKTTNYKPAVCVEAHPGDNFQPGRIPGVCNFLILAECDACKSGIDKQIRQSGPSPSQKGYLTGNPEEDWIALLPVEGASGSGGQSGASSEQVDHLRNIAGSALRGTASGDGAVEGGSGSGSGG